MIIADYTDSFWCCTIAHDCIQLNSYFAILHEPRMVCFLHNHYRCLVQMFMRLVTDLSDTTDTCHWNFFEKFHQQM